MITPASERPDDQARLILEALPAAAYACDHQGRITYFNRYAAEIWGREPKLGEPADAWMATALREGCEATEQEVVIERPNGARRIATARVEPMRGEGGRIRGAVAVLVDVTDRRIAEQDERFASFLRHLPAAAWIKDVEGRYTYANTSAERIFGLALADLRGKGAEEALRASEERYRRLSELLPVAVYTCTAPEGTISYFNKKAIETWGRAPAEGDTDERLCASFQMFRTDGKPLEHQDSPMAAALRQGIEVRNEELIIERKDGSRTTIVVNIDPIRDATGRIIGAVNAFHDVSALTAVEQALREEKENLQAVLDTAPVAVLIAHDAECIRITGNRAAEDLLQIAPGANFSKTAPTGERPTHYRTLKQGRPIEPEQLPVQRAARGEIVSADEVEIVFDDRHVVHALISARPIYDAGGRPRGAVACVLDVTSLKAAETTLKDADRRKDEFLATLGHELRNPLAPIRMGLELMAMLRGDPEKLEQTRSMMERQARQLIRLVDDLLDVSRITRGKIELRKERIKLMDAIRSAAEASIPFLEEARHELRLDVASEQIVLLADSSRLTQVLSNLLNNAGKYTPAGGRITLTARREGREAVIRIQDNGVGIPAEMLDRIFDMFTQVKDSQETGHAGLGIGLTLVRVLVEMHGGRIYVESEGIGRGSVFVIHLPILDVDPGPDPEASLRGGEEAMGRRLRVLVVDDNRAAAETASGMVELLGHETRTAGDGAEAVAIAAEFLPDVVVMDLGMPAMNGYEAAHHIRRQPWGKRMLLVALSGWGQNEHKERAAEAGFDRHLVKPAEPTELKQLLAEAARRGDRAR